MLLLETLAYLIDKVRQSGATGRPGERLLDELGLAAFAVGRHYQSARDVFASG